MDRSWLIFPCWSGGLEAQQKFTRRSLAEHHTDTGADSDSDSGADTGADTDMDTDTGTDTDTDTDMDTDTGTDTDTDTDTDTANDSPQVPVRCQRSATAAVTRTQNSCTAAAQGGLCVPGSAAPDERSKRAVAHALNGNFTADLLVER